MTNKEEIIENSENFIHAILRTGNDFKNIIKYAKKVDFNYIYMSQWTPTTAAAFMENIEVLKYLRKKGVDLNQTNEYKQTALYYAFRYNKIESAKYLLSLPEVKKDLADMYGTKPIDWANYWDYKTLKSLYNKNSENDLVK